MISPNRPQRREPAATARAEREYSRALVDVAAHVGTVVRAFPPGEPASLHVLEAMLRGYARNLTPWAMRMAQRMIDEVDERDREAWRQMSHVLGENVRRLIFRAPVGRTTQELVRSQVQLITSLPLEAAQRVHDLTIKRLEDSSRAAELARDILETGEVTASRATLIARTEVSRTATSFMQARATHAGSEGYIWRTSRDGAVRKGHKDMEGKYCSWNNPPAVVENGRVMHFHAGCIWNCRCWPEPVIRSI